jgi:ABC-2 type transport system ATP-binding protein
MTQATIRVEHLSHRYSREWAIRDIHFELHRKGVLGLLGSNGAGKSTTMNILCGALEQTEGKVTINGVSLREHPLEAKKHIGFLPQQAPLHLELTVDEYLVHCARLRGMPTARIKAAVQRAKEQCGVAHFSGRLIGNLSGGYRQRVGIAQAIVHGPGLVVLDEPTNGLDPNQVREVRRLILEIAADRTVILSTHILREVQACCDTIKMIELGRMVFSGTLEQFNNYIAPHSMVMQLGNPPPLAAICALEGVTRAEVVNPGTIRFHFDGSPDVAETVVAASVREGWRLREIGFDRTSIEDVFSELSDQARRRNAAEAAP